MEQLREEKWGAVGISEWGEVYTIEDINELCPYGEFKYGKEQESEEYRRYMIETEYKFNPFMTEEDKKEYMSECGIYRNDAMIMYEEMEKIIDEMIYSSLFIQDWEEFLDYRGYELLYGANKEEDYAEESPLPKGCLMPIDVNANW